MSVYEISLTEKDEPMLMTMGFCIVIVLCMWYVYEVFAQQRKEDEHAISGMMLRGHIFRTMRSLIAFECHQAFYNDFRCHSFNYVISEEVCNFWEIGPWTRRRVFKWMVGFSSKKKRSMKETNKVIRFDYRKVKCNSLLKRYTFAKVCKEKKSSLYSLFKVQTVQVCTQIMTC